MTFSPDGNTLAVGLGFDHGIALWDIATEKPGPRLDAGGQVNDVAFSPDGKTVAASVGDESGAVQLWDITTQQELAALPMPEGAWTIAFSPDGALLAVCTGNSSGKTVLWSIATRQQVGAALDGSISDQPFSPDSTKLILRGPNDIVLWDIAAHLSSHSFTSRLNRSNLNIEGAISRLERSNLKIDLLRASGDRY